jgi:hypothetical protein
MAAQSTIFTMLEVTQHVKGIPAISKLALMQEQRPTRQAKYRT